VGVAVSDGLTKRDLFAMAALQGILACQGYSKPENAARHAVAYADALLKELGTGYHPSDESVFPYRRTD
jgi:hypothetical protein